MSVRVAAIYTTYRPNADFIARIAPIVQCCAATIVVDNTPGGHFFGDATGLVILQDGVNKGLGRALNLGIEEARRLDCSAVVLFDQDSTPDAGFVDALVDAHRRLGSREVCIGPRLLDDSMLGEHSRARAGTPAWSAAEVSHLATSGMFFSLLGMGADDTFSEDFFLDFVDYDWCWRMHAKGWHLCRLDHLSMPHRLGLSQKRLLGLTYHVPAPYRHYFQFRNTLRLLVMPHVPLGSKLRLGLILAPKFIVYPFVLDRGVERVHWMLRGIRDAIRGIGGVGAAGSALLPSRDNSIKDARS